MTDHAPDISIIIPAKNGAPRIVRVLDAIFAQQTASGFEVIVIDSGSTDATMEILAQYPVRIYQIPPEEFSHSRTRNHGARLSLAAKYLVFLNQDAVPSDEQWLDNLVRSIEFVPSLTAVCATELIEGKSYFNLSGVASYVFRTPHTRGVHIIEPHIMDRLQSLPKSERRELFPFTTVCAIFDKGHFLAHPFDEAVPWGEDLHWAVTNSGQGYAAGCTTLACVYHHHDYTESEARAIRMHTREICRQLFDWPPAEADEMTADILASPAVDPHLQAVLNSLSWRITAPLRRVHTSLLNLLGRGGGKR